MISRLGYNAAKFCLSISLRSSPSTLKNTISTRYRDGRRMQGSTCYSETIYSIRRVKWEFNYLQARSMDSLSKTPTGRPPRTPSSKMTGSWLIPCLFIRVIAEKRLMFGVAVQETEHLLPYEEHSSDTLSTCMYKITSIQCHVEIYNTGYAT